MCAKTSLACAHWRTHFKRTALKVVAKKLSALWKFLVHLKLAERCGKALQDLTSHWTGLHIAKTSRLSSFNTRYGGLSTFETTCNVLVKALGSRTSPNSLQV
ncbi:TPA: hypothetical protein ACH3X3_011478 [Trebouxia sp. C0006]